MVDKARRTGGDDVVYTSLLAGEGRLLEDAAMSFPARRLQLPRFQGLRIRN